MKGHHTMLSNIKKQYQKAKDSDSGFTIIEVMIVLVIAAVIILIVFLAVPALQRNSRNNQRKNDASRISTATQEFINNNAGEPPATAAQVVDVAGDLSFYDEDSEVGRSVAAVNATGQDIVAGGFVSSSGMIIWLGAQCEGGDRLVPGSESEFAVVYFVETSGDFQGQCI